MKPLESYSPQEPKPLAGYAALTLVFNSLVVGFALERARSGGRLPERLPVGDLALLSAATYKLSRMISKDRVLSFARAPFTRYQGESERPSEVSETPRGGVVRQSVGELLVCPYCLSQWVGAAFLGVYLLRPRLARSVAAMFAIVAGSDFLQQAWVGVDNAV